MREKERERNADVREIHRSVASHTHPTRDLAHDPDKCPDQESNWRPFSSQAGTQSTESHQPGLSFYLFINFRKTGREGEKNINLLFHLLMCSLVSCFLYVP